MTGNSEVTVEIRAVTPLGAFGEHSLFLDVHVETGDREIGRLFASTNLDNHLVQGNGEGSAALVWQIRGTDQTATARTAVQNAIAAIFTP